MLSLTLDLPEPAMADAADERMTGDPLQSPLGALRGRRPSAPDWFAWALGHTPERSTVEVEGAAVEVLAWGRRGDPGLLLLHGFAAHADWWSFIAPFLAQDGRRVVAMSWSGMGQSGWRGRYSLDQHAREALAVAEAGGLFEAPVKPVVAAHSYGSFVTYRMIARHGDRFRAAIAIDSPVPTQNDGRGPRLPTSGRRRIYPTLEAALARFRFAPVQPCENLFARGSLAEVEDGWTWRFDPGLRDKIDYGEGPTLLTARACPLAIMIGARSKLMTPERLDYIRRSAPGAPWVEIPDAGHHLMADQPLAFIAGLRGLLAGWPEVESPPGLEGLIPSG
jgi:pimeloyl-ACP methyl ester carboxylesterase